MSRRTPIAFGSAAPAKRTGSRTIDARAAAATVCATRADRERLKLRMKHREAAIAAS